MEKSYLEKIFDEVVEIMKTDSSTCKDREGAEAQKFRDMITDGMSDDDFLFVVDSYLCSFGVYGHVRFYSKRQRHLPFKVRRFENELYITQATAGCEVKEGERIVSIDGLDIACAAEKYAAYLYGEPIERQGVHWQDIINFCKKIVVADSGGTLREVKLKGVYLYAPRQPFEFRRYGEDTAYLRLDNFFDAGEVKNFIDEYDGLICSCKNLIIDVRNNCGGSDAVFIPLLKYCIDDGVNLRDLTLEYDKDEINYTQRTCDYRIKLFEKLRGNSPKALAPYYDGCIRRHIENCGKGFVVCEGEEPFDVTGCAVPERVFVLSDCMCASTGESFVQLVSQLRKVKVVGRPTMGILDYSNLAEQDFGGYVLCYPTSRSQAIDSGRGMEGKGVGVDIYIPWSPSFINDDGDIAAVLKLLQ